MKETRQMENIEELLDFFLVANDETRRNVTGLMKVQDDDHDQYDDDDQDGDHDETRRNVNGLK